jgi:hypothetical protein
MKSTAIALALLFLLFCSEVAISQVNPPQNSNADPDKVADSIQRKNVESGASQKMTGDNKQTFWGTLGVIGSYVGETGNTITFEPSLYNIASLVNKDIKKEDNYRKEKFIQSFQLNLGFNAAQSGGFTLDSMQFGATYAIKNNKKLTQKDYAELAAQPSLTALLEINNTLTAALANKQYPQSTAAIRALITDTSITIDDLAGIPPDLIKDVLNAARIAYPDPNDLDHLKSLLVNAFNSSSQSFKAKTDELAKRSLVTASFNSIVNFLNGHWQEYDFTPVNWYVYLFRKSKFLNTPGLNISATYVLADDTSNMKPNLNRDLAKASVGINFVAWQDAKTQQPYIEIKPAATFQYIWQGKYTKDTTTMVKPSVTLRFDFTKNVSFPITLGYDKSKPNNLFGFLSIQYTPGK